MNKDNNVRIDTLSHRLRIVTKCVKNNTRKINHSKGYYISEHLWRAGRWILGLLVIFLWGAPPLVFVAYTLLGVYEQLHGYICRFIERVLHLKQEHDNYE